MLQKKALGLLKLEDSSFKKMIFWNSEKSCLLGNQSGSPEFP